VKGVLLTSAFVAELSSAKNISGQPCVADAIVRGDAGVVLKAIGGGGSGFCSQRVALGVLDRVEREIDIEIWPLQMPGIGSFDSQDRVDGRLFEPGELVEREEVLGAVDEHPEAVL
jgi:hypothetical protein